MGRGGRVGVCLKLDSSGIASRLAMKECAWKVEGKAEVNTNL